MNVIDETKQFELKQMVNIISRWLKLAEEQEQEFLENPLPLMKKIVRTVDETRHIISKIKEIIEAPRFYRQPLFDASNSIEINDPYRLSYEKLEEIKILLSTYKFQDFN